MRERKKEEEKRMDKKQEPTNCTKRHMCKFVSM